LFPDGQQNTGRSKAKNCLSFEDFAKQSFKVNHLYAKQALAIANYSPELLALTERPDTQNVMPLLALRQ
jgi:hypothetical protein